MGTESIGEHHFHELGLSSVMTIFRDSMMMNRRSVPAVFHFLVEAHRSDTGDAQSLLTARSFVLSVLAPDF